jgi:hypothetical protein
MGNEQGETEAHVEPSSTFNEGFEGVNEGDKVIESQEEESQCSNDPNPAIEAIDLRCNSSKSHQDSLRKMAIPVQVKQPLALFSYMIKELYDADESDDNESVDNSCQNSGGYENGIAISEGNKVAERLLSPPKFAEQSPES